jgi:hypothetical protein
VGKSRTVAHTQWTDDSFTCAASFERDQNNLDALVILYLVQADLALFLRHAPVVLSANIDCQRCA